MRLLLDTHIWLWAHVAPERISEPVRTVLSSRDAELWLSPVTLWESLLLADRGRLDLQPSPRQWIAEALRRVPMRDAPVSRQVVLLMSTLELPTRDPGDRFLVATAKAFNLTMATADRQIIESGEVEVLAND